MERINTYRQFYSLSKRHHPDHNPNDPKAAERFMKVSEAYATLGSLQKRQRYDRDRLRSQTSSPHARQGSYSSTASPVGARPASGLSRRRAQFRGPPPSFYRSGGWGVYREKRQAQADSTAQAYAQAAARSNAGGMGHGQGQAGFSNDVPHFDQEAHFRTQEQQERRRKQRLRTESIIHEEGVSMLARFLIIVGVVSLACSPFLFLGGQAPVSFQKGRKEKN